MKKTALLLALSALLIPIATAAAQQKPNVIFIVCDDLNTHVSTSGYPHILTPAFTQLAESGMTFSRTYCQYPVCGPSRASFLSGLYPQSNGVLDNSADIRTTRPNVISIPQAFKDQGYWTGGTGKIFHNVKADHGETAWNEFSWFKDDEMPIEAAARKKFEAEHGPVTKGKNRKAWNELLLTVSTQTRNQMAGYGPSGLTDDQHADGKNAKLVRTWLDGKSYGNKPFFIAVGIHKPHVPFLAPDRYFDLYPKDGLKFDPPPQGLWDNIPPSAVSKSYQNFGFELGVENDALRREYMQAYHACISFIDAQIGTIFESLKKNGLWENTIIVLTSDHGYHLGDHFLWGKVTLFDIGARVPLVIRAPGVSQPGSKATGLVELVDLFPTLTELCGLTPPDYLQGKSLVPMLKDTKTPGKDVAYTVVSRRNKLGKAIYTDRWRYTLWPDGEELYDLTKDVVEHHNLAKIPEQKENLETLRNLLDQTEKRASLLAN